MKNHSRNVDVNHTQNRHGFQTFPWKNIRGWINFTTWSI